MKKKIAILTCALLVPALTACGSKKGDTLVCTNTQYNGGYTSIVSIEFNGNNTEITGAEIKAIINFEGHTVQELGCTTNTIVDCVDQLVNTMEGSCNGDSLVQDCLIANRTSTGFVFTARVKNKSLAKYFLGQDSSGFSLQTSRDDVKRIMETRSSTVMCN